MSSEPTTVMSSSFSSAIEQLGHLEGDLAVGDLARRGALREVADDHRGAAPAVEVVAQEDALAAAVGGGQQAGTEIARPVARIHGQYVEVGPGRGGAAAAEEGHAAMVRRAVRRWGRGSVGEWGR